MPIGKKPAQVRRREIVEEQRKRDAERKKKALKDSQTIGEVKQRPHSKPTRPGSAYRNPKIVPRETSCCLDKERALPEVFKQCPDCPKLTEAGSN